MKQFNDRIVDDVDPKHREEAKGYFTERYGEKKEPVEKKEQINWTKPIEYLTPKHGWVPAIFYDHIGRDMRPLLIYLNANNGECAVLVALDQMHRVRNTPPVPRTCEAWAVVYETGRGTLKIGELNFSDEEDAKAIVKAGTAGAVAVIKINYTEELKTP